MDGWYVVSERMLISILSVSVEPLEMQWAETALVLAPLCEDLKPEDLSLPSDVRLRDIKFSLNPVLLVCHFLGSLGRLGLG